MTRPTDHLRLTHLRPPKGQSTNPPYRAGPPTWNSLTHPLGTTSPLRQTCPPTAPTAGDTSSSSTHVLPPPPPPKDALEGGGVGCDPPWVRQRRAENLEA